jgi:hypothetical protein
VVCNSEDPCAPTPAHFVFDKMSFSKCVRVQNIGAGASHIAELFIYARTSFFDFAFHITEFTEASPSDSGPTLVDRLETFGVQYHGKATERTMAFQTQRASKQRLQLEKLLRGLLGQKKELTVSFS